MTNSLLTQLIYPDDETNLESLRFQFLFPPLFTRVLAEAIEKLCETPIRKFDLDYTGDESDVQSDILVLGYEEPHSMVALKLSGRPGAKISFLKHSHPAGEDTIQLRGSTLDGDQKFAPGATWSIAEDSTHHPCALLDENGEYLAISYWPQNTVLIDS